MAQEIGGVERVVDLVEDEDPGPVEAGESGGQDQGDQAGGRGEGTQATGDAHGSSERHASTRREAGDTGDGSSFGPSPASASRFSSAV